MGDSLSPGIGCVIYIMINNCNETVIISELKGQCTGGWWHLNWGGRAFVVMTGVESVELYETHLTKGCV
jgi:hypothetical protein